MMELMQYSVSVNYAISQLNQMNSEDAAMHSFYLTNLLKAMLNPVKPAAVVESTPENRQDRIKRLFVENSRFGASAMSPENRQEPVKYLWAHWEEHKPVTLLIWGDDASLIASEWQQALSKHYGTGALNDSSMVLTGRLNVVQTRPEYEIEGITIVNIHTAVKALIDNVKTGNN